MAENPDNSKSLPVDPPSYEYTVSSETSPTLTPLSSTLSASRGYDRNPRPALNSSSSFRSLKNGAPEKKKDVPYKPSSDLQAQIDKLGGSVSNLTTFSTGAQTEYFDVLPSFQMFQSILKRNDFEFDEPTLGNPPVYGDTTRSSPSPPSGLSPMHSHRDITSVLQSASEQLEGLDVNDDDEAHEGQYLFSDNEMEDGLQRRSRLRTPLNRNHSSDRSQSVGTPVGAVTHESFGHSVLDNIDMLPTAKTSPLSVEIFVTKDVPVPNQPSEFESKLKEYTCGDMVNGYVVITNNLDKDVNFGLFIVSLECTIKAVHSRRDNEVIKVEKILQKKPLKMYDLNASYNEAAIPSSVGIEYECLERDLHDGCLMGLPNDRILKPHEKYKKFVTFRFPEMLLDNSCPHGVLRHTMPPPTFGIDVTAFQKRAGSIAVNKALGYGLLSVRGSPLKVRDYDFEDVSVSYSIEAKFIDKQHEKDQKLPVLPDDINDPENQSNYVVSKSSQFFLRFIPDIEVQIETALTSISHFGMSSTSGLDDWLYNVIAKRSTWHFIRQMNLSIEEEIESSLNKREFSDQQLKRKHIQIGRVPYESGDTKRLIEKNGASHVRQEFLNQKILFTHEPTEIVGKKKKSFLLSVSKIGYMTLGIRVPDKLIPYGSPRLLQKYNNGLADGSLAASLSRNGSQLSLKPVVSNHNMTELYNRGDDSVIKNLEVQLLFDADDASVKPPHIALIDISVVAWSYKTEYPIPVSFEHDFFYSKADVPGVVMLTDDVENTKMNLQELKDLVHHYIEFLKETKTFVSQNAFSYLKGLSKLGVKKDTIEDYFQTINTRSFSADDWKPVLKTSKVTWSRSLLLPLVVANKNNVTLPPSFQSCLVGRLYALQVQIKFKGGEVSHNRIKLDVPVLVG